MATKIEKAEKSSKEEYAYIAEIKALLKQLKAVIEKQSAMVRTAIWRKEEDDALEALCKQERSILEKLYKDERRIYRIAKALEKQFKKGDLNAEIVARQGEYKKEKVPLDKFSSPSAEQKIRQAMDLLKKAKEAESNIEKIGNLIVVDLTWLIKLNEDKRQIMWKPWQDRPAALREILQKTIRRYNEVLRYVMQEEELVKQTLSIEKQVKTAA